MNLARIILAAAMVAAMLLTGPAAATAGSRSWPAGPPTEVIVVLDGTPLAEARRGFRATAVQQARSGVRGEARHLGVVPDRTFGVITRAFTTTVTPGVRARLEAQPGVLAVLDDTETSYADQLALTPDISGRPRPRRLPDQVRSLPGLRIGIRDLAPRVGTGRGSKPIDADVAIVDTGISRHPDLRVEGGKDCTRSGSWADGWGHGIAIAGIIGARDNGKGIVGLAPGARLWSVRVFDRHARSRFSNHLCALDWIAGRRDRRDRDRPFFEAVNMSFTFRSEQEGGQGSGSCGHASRDIFRQGICRIVRQGTIVVGAAGNQGRSVGGRQPAMLADAIGVSAMADFDGRPGGRAKVRTACGTTAVRERDDRFARYSNYGTAIDLVAPGTCIWSTYLRGSYALVTGTSFAAPVVLAAALWYRRAHPDAKPGQVRQALVRAGRHDWRRGSDRDRVKEPRVDVRRFGPPPVFEYAEPATLHLRRDGGSRTIDLVRRRLHGHMAAIAVTIVDRPAGVRATLDGARLRLDADRDAPRGDAVVVLRATDGELVRTIRVPLWIMDEGDPTPTPRPTPSPSPMPIPSPSPSPEPEASPGPSMSAEPAP